MAVQTGQHGVYTYEVLWKCCPNERGKSTGIPTGMATARTLARSSSAWCIPPASELNAQPSPAILELWLPFYVLCPHLLQPQLQYRVSD